MTNPFYQWNICESITQSCALWQWTQNGNYVPRLLLWHDLPLLRIPSTINIRASLALYKKKLVCWDRLPIKKFIKASFCCRILFLPCSNATYHNRNEPRLTPWFFIKLKHEIIDFFRFRKSSCHYYQDILIHP